MPNLGIKSATAHNCERGLILISSKGTPPVQTDHSSTNIEAAGSGDNPAQEENLGLTCVLKYLSCLSLITVAVRYKQLQTLVYTFAFCSFTPSSP